ncbi:MAG: FliM/FliN family flagellar motor switch protein, partial [Gammaproteobacteria bacterium]
PFTRAPAAPHLRWLAVREGQGEVAVAFERTLLVGLLEARYGGKGRGQPLRDPGSERVSATEERLAHTLTLQLARTLSARVGAGAVKLSAHAQATASPAGSSWVVEVVLRQAQGGGAARCWLAPAPAMMDTILKMLAPQRERATVRATPAPLASTLKVRLDGRLASKDITLEALFALQVGDVIPVNVGRADVLLDEARLFTAAVAEHKGQLCLTAFEDAE